MNKEEVERLYKELILPESKEPYHFEKQDEQHVMAYNPVCGDKYRIYTEKEPMHFHGMGCALSKASASLLMRQLEQMPAVEQKEQIKHFIDAVQSGQADDQLDKSLAVLVALKNYDGREDCILLAWKAMLEYLENPSKPPL